MLRQPLARRKIGTARFTAFSNFASVPGFTSICAISVIMIGPLWVYAPIGSQPAVPAPARSWRAGRPQVSIMARITRMRETGFIAPPQRARLVYQHSIHRWVDHD